MIVCHKPIIQMRSATTCWNQLVIRTLGSQG